MAQVPLFLAAMLRARRLIFCLLLLWAGTVSAQGPLDPPDPFSEGTLFDSLETAETQAAVEADWGDELKEVTRRLKALEDADQKRTEADQVSKAASTGRPTTNWTGQLQSDFYWFTQDEENKATVGEIENGTAFRRARVGMFGAYGPTLYRIEMDFARSNRPAFVDVWAGVKDIPTLGTVRVGHFFEPFSLERLTPNRFTTFMERSLPDQCFVPGRNLGVMAQNTWNGERGTWALGLFRTDSDGFGDDVGDPFESAVTGRVTALPWYQCEGREYLHLGLGASWRDTDGNIARFRARPEARIGAAVPNVPFFVDTGNIQAHNFGLVGLESAWVNGPFSLQGEYVLTPVNALGADTLYFSSWYCTASYFLTGEHRPYRRDIGAFDRVHPKREVVRYSQGTCLETGPGAWEIALRLSHADLNDGFVRGGILTDLTVGLNWYLNPHLRFTTNYVRAFLDDPQDGKSQADIYAMRVGFEF